MSGSSKLFRRAMILSVVAYIAIAGVLGFVGYRMMVGGGDESPEQTAQPTSTTSRSSTPRSIEPKPVDKQPEFKSPEEVIEEEAPVKIAAAIEEASNATEEENLDKLASLGNQLENFGTEKGVDELTGKFREWVGTEQRASAPAEEPTEGQFDFETAQFHEVIRQQGKTGQWEYKAIMVDAEGRTMETEMDPVAGQSAFDTMELVKQFPLAEKVYRQIAMPLLDQTIAAAKAAEVAAQEIEKERLRLEAEEAGKDDAPKE